MTQLWRLPSVADSIENKLLFLNFKLLEDVAEAIWLFKHRQAVDEYNELEQWTTTAWTTNTTIIWLLLLFFLIPYSIKWNNKC